MLPVKFSLSTLMKTYIMLTECHVLLYFIIINLIFITLWKATVVLILQMGKMRYRVTCPRSLSKEVTVPGFKLKF